jgi:hypothetical protein
LICTLNAEFAICMLEDMPELSIYQMISRLNFASQGRNLCKIMCMHCYTPLTMYFILHDQHCFMVKGFEKESGLSMFSEEDLSEINGVS